MLLSEFENHTGFRPDTALFAVIQSERDAKTDDGKEIWSSDAQFCNAYKFDEDGIAQKCQKLANDERWRMDEQYRTAQEKSDNRVHGLYNENQLLRKEVEDQIARRSQLEADKQELEREIENMRKLIGELRSDKRRADMFRVLEQYVRDDVDVQDIGRTVIAYVDLLDWEACYGTDN